MKIKARPAGEEGYPSNINARRIIIGQALRPLRKAFLYFASLSGVYILALFASVGEESSLITAANIIGPISLIIATSILILSATRRYSLLLWTPYTFYLAGTALFFGLGPLVVYFGNEATIAALHRSVYGINHYDLLKANLLNATGVASALLGFHFSSRVTISRNARKTLQAPTLPKLSPETLAAGFLLAGAALRYLLILPYQFGMTEFVLPGAINKLAYLFDLGLALTAYLAVRKGGRWTWLLWLLLPLHILSAVLQFSKEAVVIALMMPGLGAYLAHRSMKRLALWGIAIGISFYSVQPLINYGRGAIQLNTGTIRNASLRERIEIFHRFIAAGGPLSPQEARAEQSAWLRINYLNKQAYVMSQRDQGYSFGSLSNIGIAIVPRILWQDKSPSLSPGTAFYEYTSGSNSSSAGITVYADAYWNFGWLGTILVSSLFGAILALTSRWTLYWLSTGQLIFLPVIFLSLHMALRSPTSFIQNGIVWSSMIYFAYVITIYLVFALLRVGFRARTPLRKM